MRFASLTLLLVLAACGDDGTGTDESADAAPDHRADLGPLEDGAVEDAAADGGLAAERMDIGTGQLEYVPLPADRTIELVQGLQGGVHIDLALRIWGLAPDDLALRYRGFLADSGAEVFTPVDRALNADRVLDVGDHLVRAGDRLILDEALFSRTDVLVGREVRVEVTATPPDGPAVRATTVVVIIDER